MRLGVRRKRFGAVYKSSDSTIGERRNPVNALLHVRHELVPVLVQQGKLKWCRQVTQAHGQCITTKTPHQQAANFLTAIDQAVRIPKGGHIRIDVIERFGQRVEMLHRIKRDIDIVSQTKIARPHARTIYNRLTPDQSLISLHTGDGIGLSDCLLHLDTFQELCPTLLCLTAVRGRQCGGVNTAISRTPQCAHQVVRFHGREFLLHFRRRDRLDGCALVTQCSDNRIKFLKTFFGACKHDPAARTPSNGMSLIKFRDNSGTLGIYLDGHGIRTHPDNISGRVPGCAAADLPAFQYHHI